MSLLILKRKLHEKIVITYPDGVRVTIQIVEAGYGVVRLAFDAPPEVGIDRQEVRESKDREASGG